MKKIVLILAVIIFAKIVYFIYLNGGQILVLNCKPVFKTLTINSGLFYSLYAFGAALGGFLISSYFSFGHKDKVKKLSRNYEKSSIISEESADKIKALEAKIQTLEKALKETLNKN